MAISLRKYSPANVLVNRCQRNHRAGRVFWPQQRNAGLFIRSALHQQGTGSIH